MRRVRYLALVLAGILTLGTCAASVMAYAEPQVAVVIEDKVGEKTVPKRKEVVDYALSWVGKVHYADYGKGEKSKTDGLVEGCASDCSWFIYNVLHHFDLMKTYARSVGWGADQVPEAYVIDIDIEDAEPGDIEFWDEGNNQGHVAIYVGDGKAVACNGYFTAEYAEKHDGHVGEVELTDYRTTIGRNPDKILRLSAFAAEDKRGGTQVSGNSVSFNRLTDVPRDYFAYYPVRWAVRKGIASGTNATKFSPKASCTRAQIVSFLYRMYGGSEDEDLTSMKLTFKDVPEGAYYADAVKWAVKEGIASGKSSTKFAPHSTCTRAEAMTFLYKAIGNGKKVSPKTSFTDVKSGRFYTDAVNWATVKGITSGVGKNKFGTTKKCTRAQIITFLYKVRHMEV